MVGSKAPSLAPSAIGPSAESNLSGFIRTLLCPIVLITQSYTLSMSKSETGLRYWSVGPPFSLQTAELSELATASCSRESRRFHTAGASGFFERLVRRALYLRWAVSAKCEATLADDKGGL